MKILRNKDNKDITPPYGEPTLDKLKTWQTKKLLRYFKFKRFNERVGWKNWVQGIRDILNTREHINNG